MEDVYERSISGSINKEDALKLLDENPFDLFKVADELRKNIVGDEVSFVVNRNIDITDQCMIQCGFCAFYNNLKYHMTIDEILESVGEAIDVGATEITLFSGVNPKMTVEYYCEVISSIKNSYEIDIHGLSPVEVFHAAKFSKMSTIEALETFKSAGLDTLTGASAEILVDSVREKICPKKVSTSQWVDVIKKAHSLNIPTTSTIMYGTVETWEDRVDHLLLLRDIQRETHGFTELVPLPFLDQNNILGLENRALVGMDDLKLHAIARVILARDIPNIQASWIKLGTKLSQIILNCGANDLGGTMMEDKISIAAGAAHGEHLPREGMSEIITNMGRIPKQRNTLYQPTQYSPKIKVLE